MQCNDVYCTLKLGIFFIVLYSALQCTAECTAQCNTVQYSAVQCSIVQYSPVQYNAVQCTFCIVEGRLGGLVVVWPMAGPPG